MTLMNQTSGFVFLIIFGIIMIILTKIFSRIKQNKESFLVADRKIKWFIGGPSIAASWIWAGALFISIQMAFEKGLAGIFWFTFPNILALILFAIWAPKIREKFHEGFTLPEFIRKKFKSEKLHKIYLIPFFFNQIIAITFNAFAGGTMISLLTGIPLTTILPILIGIALIYTMISGVEASIITDMVQMILILAGIFLVVPWAVSIAGGFSALSGGFGGLSGDFRNIFDPRVMFSLGVLNSIGLISGTIADQQYWQRTFSLKKKHISKAFIFGGLLFAIVPIMLSLLGFLGANPSVGIVLPEGTDPSLIGVATVSQLLPPWVTALFVVMMMAGLSSTIDSGIVASSSLWVIDVKKKNGKNTIKSARFAMISVATLGLLLAYSAHFIEGIGLQHLWFLSISMVASISIPTIMSLYSNKISAKGMFWGILTAIVIGMPIFFYANLINNLLLQVASSLFMISTSTLITLIVPKSKPFK